MSTPVDVEQARSAFEAEIDIVVHDLSGPLARVIGCLQLMRDLIEQQEYTDLDQLVEIALNGAQLQLNTMTLMQEVTKLKAGLKRFEPQRCGLGDIVAGAVMDTAALAEEAGTTVQHDLPANLPDLYVDCRAASRVLTQMLDNALRHVPDDGQVQLVAVPEADATGIPMLRIGVLDNGKGVPADQRERIFEKFAQVPKSALRGRRGLGLGLTYCKLTIEAHGGKIWVEDAPGGGAAFWLTLPVAVDQPEDSAGNAG